MVYQTETIPILLLAFQMRFLPTQRYASAVFAVIACRSVRPSQVVVVPRLNISRKQCSTIAQGL